ncbi:MAG: nucleotidyltransferase domain-containing protein [Bacteroidetes bacterium]|nr:nucleotidyltransferase domain-containing protein [Bacteroidota bacterium]
MEPSEYIASLANRLCQGKEETNKIETSFKYLKSKLFEHFVDRISAVEIFGSFARGTALPQSIDEMSDVGVLVVFKKNDLQPATFIKHLKEFADKIYPRSNVEADHPAILVELFHVRFELVPAYWHKEWLSAAELKIPAPRDKDVRWITSEPEKLRSQIEEFNLGRRTLLRSLIRLIKHYNVFIGRPYESYQLEQLVLLKEYRATTVWEAYLEFVKFLDAERVSGERARFINNLKWMTENTILLSQRKMNGYIEPEFQKFLPLVS